MPLIFTAKGKTRRYNLASNWEKLNNLLKYLNYYHYMLASDLLLLNERTEVRPREDVREDLGGEPGADAGEAHGDGHLAHRRHQHGEDRLMHAASVISAAQLH